MLTTKLKLTTKQVLLLEIPQNIIETHNLISINSSNPEAVIGYISELNQFAALADQFFSCNLASKSMLSLIYPKPTKTNKELNRDSLMAEATKHDLDACRLISVDDKYSCMSFRKLEDIDKHKPSQCVADYADRVDELCLLLNDEIKVKFYALTPGYKKDWARFVFSAVQQATQKKRIEIVHTALAEGYKTIDAYKSAQKKM